MPSRPTHHALRQTSPASSGFTLIELLVVIAIISLLVSILLPSLNKAKDLARTVICATNLKGIGTGLTFYMQDFDGKLPPSQDEATQFKTYNYPTGALAPTWSNYIARMYLGGKEGADVYFCPSAPKSWTSDRSNFYPDYGFNDFLSAWAGEAGVYASAGFNDYVVQWGWSSPDEVKHPTEIIALGDTGHNIGGSDPSNYINPVRGYYRLPHRFWAHLRHNGGPDDIGDGTGNFLYVDQHVDSVTTDHFPESDERSHPLHNVHFRNQ